MLWRPAGEQRLVLRLWPSDYLLKPNGRPLLVGAVESQYVQHIVLSLPRASHNYEQAFETLRQSLDQTRTPYQLRQRANLDSQGQWQGWVLLSGLAE